MTTNINTTAANLFEKIRSRFENIRIGDEKANNTQDPELARFFNFDFVSNDGTNFGNITVSLIDEKSVKVYFSKNITEKLNDVQKKEWYDFLRSIRMFAKRHMLAFDTRDISRSNLNLKDVKQASSDNKSWSKNDVVEGKVSRKGTLKHELQQRARKADLDSFAKDPHGNKTPADEKVAGPSGTSTLKRTNESVDPVYPNGTVIRTKKGRPVGEIYQTKDGNWGCLHYSSDNGADGINNREEALDWLQDIHDSYLQDRGQASASPLREARTDTIEAYGIKGMKRLPWRRSFKNYAQLEAWCEKFDAEVYGTRDLDAAKRGSLSPAIPTNEGRKEVVKGIAAAAGATGPADAIVVNPARTIDARGNTVANPYKNPAPQVAAPKEKAKVDAVTQAAPVVKPKVKEAASDFPDYSKHNTEHLKAILKTMRKEERKKYGMFIRRELRKREKESAAPTSSKKQDAKLDEAGAPDHTSDCGFNYGHPCTCGMKGTRHSDKCLYPYGGECSCGLVDAENVKKKMSQAKRASAMGMFSEGFESNRLSMDELKDVVAIRAAIKNLRQQLKDNPQAPSDWKVDIADRIEREAKRLGLYGVEDPVKEEQVAESKIYGINRKQSAQDVARKNARIVIKHSKPVVDEIRGARSRAIESIFIENNAGERFKVPSNSLAEARALARHVAEGGNVYDDFGKHISEMCEECNTLREFMRGTRGKEFVDETADDIVNSAAKHYLHLHNLVNNLKGQRGYREHKQMWESQSIQPDTFDEFDPAELRHRFRQEKVDPRIDRTVETAFRAYQRQSAQPIQEVDEFEQHLSQVEEGTWSLPEGDYDFDELVDLFKEPLVVGVDAMNATGALYHLIGDDGLFDMLNRMAEDDPEQDCRQAILYWLRDHMPTAHKQLAQKLGRPEPSEKPQESIEEASEDAIQKIKGLSGMK